MICKKHNWETQLIGEHKLGTVCANCGILKNKLNIMENENREITNPNQNEKPLTKRMAEEILNLLLDQVSLLIDKIIIPTQDEPDVKFWRDIKKEIQNLMEKIKD